MYEIFFFISYVYVIYLALANFSSCWEWILLSLWFNREAFLSVWLLHFVFGYNFFCMCVWLVVFGKDLGFCGIRSTNRIRWLSLIFAWTIFFIIFFFYFYAWRINIMLIFPSTSIDFNINHSIYYNKQRKKERKKNHCSLLTSVPWTFNFMWSSRVVFPSFRFFQQ